MMSDLSGVAAIVAERFGDVQITREQRACMREVCASVARRSARLAATGIATILAKRGKERDATVSVDGSVFEKVPGYKVFESSCCPL
jgi:hexokinase